MKKVAIVGTVGVPGKYGGFETLAHHLVDELSDKFDFSVYCSSKAYKKSERRSFYKGARLIYVPLKANGIQSVLYDMISIIHAMFVSDVILLLGVSGGIMVPFVRLFSRKKIIVNIDGLEWRRAKWGILAKAFLRFSERVAVKWSHADITDNAALKRYTSRKYGSLSHLIEYGGDHVESVELRKEDLELYQFANLPYAFKVARIEPENNIKMILSAFSRTYMTLVLVGNWNNSNYGKALREEYGHFPNIYLLDPIYDPRRLNVLRSNCQIYIHGHSAGGTNPTLVEAMSLGLPVFSFDVGFNRLTTENKAFYFKSASQLISLIRCVKTSELSVRKLDLFEIAQKRYTWKKIALQYANLFVLSGQKYSKRAVNSNLSKQDKRTLQKLGLSHLSQPIKYYEEL